MRRRRSSSAACGTWILKGRISPAPGVPLPSLDGVTGSAAGTVPACQEAASRTRPRALAAPDVTRRRRPGFDDDAADMITSELMNEARPRGWASAAPSQPELRAQLLRGEDLGVDRRP